VGAIGEGLRIGAKSETEFGVFLFIARGGKAKEVCDKKALGRSDSCGVSNFLSGGEGGG